MHVPSINEEKLALSIFFSMSEVSFKTIPGGVGYSAQPMRLSVVI